MSEITIKTKPKDVWKKDFIVIPYHVYPFDLLVSWHKEYTDLEEALKKRLPTDVHKEIKQFKGKYLARTFIFKSGQTCIHFKKCNEGLIAHEVFHAVFFIMDKIGCVCSSDSNEAYAYLTEYITTQIYKNMNFAD